MQYILKQKNKETNADSARRLQQELGVSDILAQVLCMRGVDTPEAAQAFLHPSKAQLHDPFLFNGMAGSVDMIKKTVTQEGSICVYGDYDVDGISGCAILYRALQRMGATVDCILPSRMEHGYGLSLEAVEGMRDYSLLITVDCGISNITEIKKAKEYGLNVIVTDHHECAHELPAADFILNPKCPGEAYPYRELCGAGVAFKLGNALAGDEIFEYIDIAAVATIADIVPLTGENRVISKLGLDKLNEDPNPGLKGLINKAASKAEYIDSQKVAYTLAPRINAAGRISTARIAFELITTENENEIERLADELCRLNADRQARQERVVREAIEMEEEHPSDRLILHYKDDWDLGIIGLAASKLSERYNKPAVLFGEAGGMYTGSARSIDGINIFEALQTQAELFEKFGGHAGAAGLTLEETHLPALKSNVNQYLYDMYAEEDFQPVRYYDVELTPGEIDGGLINELDKLKPYGYKNKPVDILICNAGLSDVRAVGDDRHARFVIKKSGSALNAIAFGSQASSVPDCADVIGNAQMNSYDNRPQMIVTTISYEPSEAQRFEAAYALLHKRRDAGLQKSWFVDRAGLLKVFTVLKGISDNKVAFGDMNALLVFVEKHVGGVDMEKLAFAFTVFEELELIDVQKSDKIKVTVHAGKRRLEDSVAYRKFFDEEN